MNKKKESKLDLSKFEPKDFNKEIKTGIIVLDFMMGGGFNPGTMIEISAESSAGKSMMCLHMSQNFIRDRHNVLYIDSEGGVTKKTLNNFGLVDVPKELFRLIETNKFTELEEIFDSILEGDNDYDIIIVDSIAGFDPSTQKSLVTEKQKIGDVATKLSALLRKTKLDFRKKGKSLILINQLRMRMLGQVSVDDSVGGKAIQFYPDIRFRMKIKEKISKIEKTVMGSQEVEYMKLNNIWCVKSRVQRSGTKFPIHIVLGRGVSNVYTIKDILENNGLIKKSGNGVFKTDLLCEGQTFRGAEKLAMWIKDNMVDIVNYLQENGLWGSIMTKDEIIEINNEQIIDEELIVTDSVNLDE